MNIFYDCGFNVGSVAAQFLGERKNGPLPDDLDLLGKDNSDTVYYGFEPNDGLLQYAECDLEDKRLILSNRLVWIEDGLMKNLYLEGRGGQSSTLYTGDGCRLKNKSITRETIDFSSFVKETHANADRVILKMDIEGSEWEVLYKMIKDESIYLITDLIVEFHGRKKFGVKATSDALRPKCIYVRDFLRSDKADWLKTKVLWRLWS
jgi:FkbM family methyltransferase